MDNSYQSLEKEELEFYRTRYEKEWEAFYKKKYKEIDVKLISINEVTEQALIKLDKTLTKHL